MNDLPITFRPAISTDYGFILKTFTQELHKVHPSNFIPNSIFFPHYTKIINNIVATNSVIIACMDDDPDQLVGYIIAKIHDNDNIILHWLHVKSIFRRLGIAKQLLDHFDYKNKNIVCSNYFNLFKQLRYNYHLIYDPTLLEEYK